MTSRERVLTALDNRPPDRVPIFVGYTPEAAETLLAHLRKKRNDPGISAADIPLIMGHDLLIADHGVGTSYYAGEGEEYTCEWGIGWRWVDIPGGRYTEIVGHPLADTTHLDSWSPPDPEKPGRYDALRALISDYGRSHGIIGGMGSILFEPAWHLRGFSTFLEDLMTDRDFARALLDKIRSYQLASGRIIAGAGADIILLGDDFGTQESLIVSPAVFREVFKPLYADLFAAFREANPAVKIAFHSDGSVEPLLDDFIEMGVDIFQAVQPKSVDTAAIKKRYGSRLRFWGAVDIQEVMPFGTPGDVRNEIRLRMETIGAGGGYILSPSHALQPDVPLANMLAFYEAAEAYGTYAS